jgi:citrate synthase
MLSSIGTVDKVPQFLQAVKDKKQLLMGFGHRVYKSYDPRAKVLKDLSREIFDLVGENPLLTLAQELERQALADSYFVERKLFPNVDFYSGLIYQAMGFPTDMFPVLFWYVLPHSNVPGRSKRLTFHRDNLAFLELPDGWHIGLKC